MLPRHSLPFHVWETQVAHYKNAKDIPKKRNNKNKKHNAHISNYTCYCPLEFDVYQKPPFPPPSILLTHASYLPHCYVTIWHLRPLPWTIHVLSQAGDTHTHTRAHIHIHVHALPCQRNSHHRWGVGSCRCITAPSADQRCVTRNHEADFASGRHCRNAHPVIFISP